MTTETIGIKTMNTVIGDPQIKPSAPGSALGGELNFHIPSAVTYCSKLNIEDPTLGEHVETNLDSINDMIASLTRNLNVCDNKVRVTESGQRDHGRTNSGDLFARGALVSSYHNGRNGSINNQLLDDIDPLLLPDAWWESGIRYVFEWMKQIFLERISCVGSSMLRDNGICFFVWKPYEEKVTLEASSCSLALMLKPWTPLGQSIDCECSSIPPNGIGEKKEEAIRELKTLVFSIEKIIRDIQLESERLSHVNPSLAEILSSCTSSMKTILSLYDKEQGIISQYRTETRHNTIVAAKAVAIIQKWIFEQTTEKLGKRVEQYTLYQGEICRQFANPTAFIQEQKEKFRQAWEQIKIHYDRFLEMKGLRHEDESAVAAMDVLFQANNGMEFTIDSVKLLKNYIHHMKKIANSNPVKSSLYRGGGNNVQLNNPVQELHSLYSKKKQELQEINNHLYALKSKSACDLTNTDIEQISQLELRRKKISEYAENSITILKNYSNNPYDDHSQWLQSLCQLEKGLEVCIKDWTGLYGQKYHKEAQLEEEIRSSISAIMSNCYSSHDRDINAVLWGWNSKQLQTDKNKNEQLRQTAMEHYIAQEWLNNFERKLVYYNDLSLVKLISEFKSISNMVRTANENLFKICEFIESYQDLVFLWKTTYSLTE